MNVSDIELFIRVADSGSFSEAARQLNISSAVASAGIKRLEKELGTTLLVRSTRQLCLSAPGRQYLRFCRRAIAELDEGSKVLLNESGVISGQLRLSIPSDIGRNCMLMLIEEFMTHNPLLSITILISDQISDFYNERIDVAIRYGELKDSNLVAFRLVTTERTLCASPTYIEKHGEPNHPDELNNHNCLLFQIGDSVFNTWEFSQDKKVFSIRVNGDRVANDADVVRRWAKRGCGIALKSKIDINKELKKGTLVHILKEFETPPLDLWLICPDRSLITPTILTLKDYLRHNLQEQLNSK